MRRKKIKTLLENGITQGKRNKEKKEEREREKSMRCEETREGVNEGARRD